MSGLVPRSSCPLRHAGRQWTMDDAEPVLDVRRDMPWSGKARSPSSWLRRAGRTLSTATVGRILPWGVETGRAPARQGCTRGPPRDAPDTDLQETRVGTTSQGWKEPDKRKSPVDTTGQKRMISLRRQGLIRCPCPIATRRSW